LQDSTENFNKAAKIVLTLRSKGITPRNTIDVLIALTAIVHNIPLLHNDKDFDRISEKISELSVL
jgi:hypothetical protein